MTRFTLTALGVKALAFFCVLTGAFFAAPYANLFFLLLVFLVVLALTGLFSCYRNSAGASGGFDAAEPVPAGRAGTLTGWIDPGKRTRFGLRLELDFGKAGRALLQSGLASGRISVSGSLPPLPRGIHKPRAAALSSSWPLGLWRFRIPVAAPSGIAVFPQPHEGPRSKGTGGAGAVVVEMVQPSGLRDFRTGDSLRGVHWKASARRGRLVLKEWDSAGTQGEEIVLDRRCDPARLEEALSRIAGRVLALREKKERLTLHTQGSAAVYGEGHTPFPELLRLLAAAEPLPPDGPAPPPAPPTAARLPAPEGDRR